MSEYQEVVEGLTFSVWTCDVCASQRTFNHVSFGVQRFYTLSEYQAHITDIHRAQVESLHMNGEVHAD